MAVLASAGSSAQTVFLSHIDHYSARPYAAAHMPIDLVCRSSHEISKRRPQATDLSLDAAA